MRPPLTWAVGDACSLHGELAQVVKLEKSWPLESGERIAIARIWLEKTGDLVTVPISELRLAAEAER